MTKELLDLDAIEALCEAAHVDVLGGMFATAELRTAAPRVIPRLVARVRELEDELRASRARVAELEAVRVAAEARRDWWNGGADGDVDSEVLWANLCEALDNVGEPHR